MISASLFKIKVTFFTRELTFVKDQGAFEGREPTPKINISVGFFFKGLNSGGSYPLQPNGKTTFCFLNKNTFPRFRE